MVNENIGTLKDLYNRVLPALKSKVKELKKNHLTFIGEKDVWNCLKNTKWKDENDLTLYDIVNDILFIEEQKIIEYLNSKEEFVIEPYKQELKNTGEEDTIL